MNYDKIIYMLVIILTIGLVGAETVIAQNGLYQGGSSSSSAAVNENGTQWTAELNMTGQRDQITNESLESVSVDEKGKTSFKGVIRAEKLCYTINQDVKKVSDGNFQMNIETVKEAEAADVCASQTFMIDYEASFQNDEEYTLDVRHNNESIDEINFSPGNDDYEPTPEEEQKSALSSVLNWFRGIF